MPSVCLLTCFRIRADGDGKLERHFSVTRRSSLITRPVCHVAGERRAVGGRQLRAWKGDEWGKITPLEVAFVRQLVEWLSFSAVLSDGRE